MKKIFLIVLFILISFQALAEARWTTRKEGRKTYYYHNGKKQFYSMRCGSDSRSQKTRYFNLGGRELRSAEVTRDYKERAAIRTFYEER